MSLTAVRARALVTEIKVVRHVRTQAGVDKYGQPIGAIIVRDMPLKHVTSTGKQAYDGWDRVKGSDGKTYDVGEDGGKYYATGPGGWDDIVVDGANSIEDAYKQLDEHVGGGSSAKPKKPTPAKEKPAPKGKAPVVRKKGDSYVRVGKGMDVRGENNHINLSGGTPETRKMKVPYDGTRTLVKFKPGDKNYDKLRALYVIPPKYETFWINDSRDESHTDDKYDGLVYVGLDPTKNKEQPVYSTRHWARQSDHKFGDSDGSDGEMSKVPELIQNRDAIIARLLKDANSRTDAKRAAAAKVLLVQALTGIRIGAEHKRDEKVSDRRYGATTLEARHVRINKDSVTLGFMAKGTHQRFDANGDPVLNPQGKNMWPGKKYVVNVKEPELVKLFRREMRGKSHSDRLFDVNSGAVNNYFTFMQKDMGLSGNMHAHNFRAAKATLTAFAEIQKTRVPKSEADFKKLRRQVVDAVGAVINDSSPVAFHSYIMPSVWELWTAKHPEWKDVKF